MCIRDSVKSGTEYSVIDMSGNTVIGRLSYASDKLMFADTVHSLSLIHI